MRYDERDPDEARDAEVCGEAVAPSRLPRLGRRVLPPDVAAADERRRTMPDGDVEERRARYALNGPHMQAMRAAAGAALFKDSRRY